MEEVWTGSSSCTPGCTICPVPPDACWWWSGAPWLDEGSGHFLNTRKCTGKINDRETDNSRGQKKRFTVYWHSHQSVHPQIFPSILIALVNSWSLFIYCRLMQLKSHYVWMDAVPFCRAARQIWVTPAGSWSFKINSGVSCHQNLDSLCPDLTTISAIMDHLHKAKLTTTEVKLIHIHRENNSSSVCKGLLMFSRFIILQHWNTDQKRKKDSLRSKLKKLWKYI